jgi:hydroxyacylglutathione hydrolase
LAVRIVPVPCLKDNYAYLVIDGTYAAVVDPSEPAPVLDAAAREGVEIGAIWLTHHHWDHVGGVEGILQMHPGAEVVAHPTDAEKAKVPKVTKKVEDGQTVTTGPLTARIIHNPGHTLGAISYVIEDAVFTGDTLFAAGCGRVFEGTMEMMHASLQKLAALPPETRVFFGHEYTASNLKFAAHAEPDNEAVKARAGSLVTPSTPSTIGDELATNPFLRAKDAAQFAERRTGKDNFKG